ncbi:MAG: pyruvate dehydrogenase complex dihydrolipoamide acetyltransferase component (E2) [Chaenotheca gracillima]|nr:MAG: pyruvate dehydrogenase complex dihydrolipoamide acetyltransferase component (E2) [Chaenotheca gracillima]
MDEKHQTVHDESHAVHRHPHHAAEIENDADGIFLDVGVNKLEDGDSGSIKLARDGHTVLVPQPSTDPEDPLNWSWFKKHAILLVVAYTAFIADFSSAAGVATIVVQGEEWNMSPNAVNYAGNLNVIMLGIGGLCWIPFVYFWGRAPVLFWTAFSGTFFTLGALLAPNFQVFYGMRALQGFTQTAAQAIGLAFIKDMFFFHEHARKIGIWVALFIVSPYAAPCFAYFILAGTGAWRNVFWMVLGACLLDLVLIVAFIDETYYDRFRPIERQPARGNRLLRLVGIWQIKVHKDYFMTVGHSLHRLAAVILKPIMIPSIIYYMLSFMWAVGINICSSILLETPVEAGGYGFEAKSIGFLYFTPIVAVILGECFGHFFNDWIANRYIRTHNGTFQPEVRLWMTYISLFVMIPGLVLLGQALEKHLHYSAIIMGWGMYVFGVMTASVAITAYTLDCYQNGSGEVAGLLNFGRVVGGFTVGYFQQPWAAKSGYGMSFGLQALIVGLAFGIIIMLQFFGHRMRVKGGPLAI